MNIRNEWEGLGLSQKVWIGLAGVVALLVVSIGCYRVVEPQTWYVVGLGTDRCISSRLEAAELGHPSVASPYTLRSWERKNSSRYEGTQTISESRYNGAEVEVENSGSFGDMFYFSKKSTCLTAVIQAEEDN